jgi:hypothetical protein
MRIFYASSVSFASPITDAAYSEITAQDGRQTLLSSFECEQKKATINGIGLLLGKITRLLRWKHWDL